MRLLRAVPVVAALALTTDALTLDLNSVGMCQPLMLIFLFPADHL
jgi:hypothetical protein